MAHHFVPSLPSHHSSSLHSALPRPCPPSSLINRSLPPFVPRVLEKWRQAVSVLIWPVHILVPHGHILRHHLSPSLTFPRPSLSLPHRSFSLSACPNDQPAFDSFLSLSLTFIHLKRFSFLLRSLIHSLPSILPSLPSFHTSFHIILSFPPHR